ncbi:MAG TPA: ubiquinone/menaquinone biosynthesis methyltransferase [Gemmatimonadaceae bacterium]|nr:ubiquinone/menaquinone biosynthesis methyltransferase [Gemmatimonadaceae bacterium]
MSALDVDRRTALAAAGGGAEKRQYVRRIFSEIAPRYDLLNHLLSLNIDKRWRARAIAMLGWRRVPDGTYVDLCAGTLDVALSLAGSPGFRGTVIGADFAEPMLRAGQRKVQGRTVRPVMADALQLPLADGAAAGIIVAFGARNLADLDAGLREAHRVLAPGGRLVILEFSTPRLGLVRTLYHLYFHSILPRIGAWVSGHRTAYRYLPESVSAFPSAPALALRLQAAEFINVAWRALTFGIAAIHVGERGPNTAGDGHEASDRMHAVAPAGS